MSSSVSNAQLYELLVELRNLLKDYDSYCVKNVVFIDKIESLKSLNVFGCSNSDSVSE